MSITSVPGPQGLSFILFSLPFKPKVDGVMPLDSHPYCANYHHCPKFTAWVTVSTDWQCVFEPGSVLLFPLLSDEFLDHFK